MDRKQKHMTSPTSVPQGFLAATGNVGIKGHEDDCLLVTSTHPCTSAAVFTQSRFAGPSVELSRASLADNGVQGIVVLSKNANVATGPLGQQHAREVRQLAADALGIAPADVLIASTGVIGEQYPMQRIRANFATMHQWLGQFDADAAARAIMTTDTRPKTAAARCGPATIVGIAKGVGMIEPNMATLLAFFFTDAQLGRPQLSALFTNVIDRTFNAMSIDTDTSTGDTASIMANGLAGPVPTDEFTDALYECALSLVRQIVSDGEGATKSITVNVSGARDQLQARRIGKAVVNSPLVKTAVHGGDPNWGRVVMAIGKLSDDTDIDPARTSVAFGGLPVYPPSTTDHEADLRKLRRYLAASAIDINIDMGIANGQFTVYGCDLSFAVTRRLRRRPVRSRGICVDRAELRQRP